MTQRVENPAARVLIRLAHIRLCWIAITLVAMPLLVCAQTDEIQVYDAAIAEQGKFNLMVHNNFTPDGRKTPVFPGGVESNHALVGVAEWAYGVTDWFEQGLYLPLYSYSQNDGATYNGFKLRWLFVKPHAAEQKFFYGVNFEFSVNQKQWDARHFTSEVRPIVGWHLKPVDIIVNPIMDHCCPKHDRPLLSLAESKGVGGGAAEISDRGSLFSSVACPNQSSPRFNC